jgi:hypothetical protein
MKHTTGNPQVFLLAACLLLAFCSGCSSRRIKNVTLRPFGFNDSGLKVITAWSNDRPGIMCTLYGNEAAWKYSTTAAAKHQAGELFRLVTYMQQDHVLWYGSKINGALQQVETISFTGNGGQPVVYSRVYGEAAQTGGTSRVQDTLARIGYITGQPAAVFP